ncbi:hypothetical protein ACKKBG_A20805 [Auxenochlorella protothecoides x Auxenochlorella symbiontica]
MSAGSTGEDLAWVAHVLTGGAQGERRAPVRQFRVTPRPGTPTRPRGGTSKSAGRGPLSRVVATSSTAVPQRPRPEDAEHGEKGLRCRLCDAWVPSAGDNWAVHVGGIRHRRAVASVRLTGAPGSHVTSIFERPEAVAGPAGRTDPAQPPGHAQAAGARRTPLLDTGTLLLDTQAAVALGYDGVLIERAQREAARSAGVDPAQARDLQRELLAALADVASLGDRLYHLAASPLTELALGAALAAMKRTLCSQAHCRSLSLSHPLHLAAAASLARSHGLLTASSLVLSAPPLGHGPGHPLLWLAAARVALRALRCAPSVGTLVLRLGGCVAAGPTSETACGPLLGALRRGLEERCMLRTLRLDAGCELQYLFLRSEVRAWPAAAAAGARRVRLAVLMGSHARLGRRSPLRLLPPALLQAVLCALGPPGGCLVEVRRCLLEPEVGAP